MALGFLFALGMLIIVGWSTGEERLHTPVPKGGRMTILTATTFLISGISLYLWQAPQSTRRICAAQIAGAVVAANGIGCTAMYFLAWRLGRNSWLPADLFISPVTPPDLMAFNTALSFTLLGGALCLLETQTPRGGRPAEWLALVAAFLPFTALVGCIFGVRPLLSRFLDSFAPTTMAITVAVGLLVLCIAVLTARPEHGWMARFSSSCPEGLVARRLLPAGIAALLLLGGLGEAGKRLGYYRRREEAALLISFSVLVFVLLIRHSMNALAELEARRRQAEAHFRKSEEHLRMALEAARIGTWEWDLETDKSWWSEAIDDIFRIPRGSFDGRLESFLQLVHPDDRDMVQMRIRRSLERAEDTIQFEYRIFWPDGTLRYLAARGNTTFAGNGTPVRMRGTAMDVTERKLLERELITASNREQRRLGQDLHDDLGQWLTAIHLEARALSMFLTPISEAGAARAEKIVSWMGEALERTRALARGMTPAVIEAGGLSAALQDLAVNTERMFHARCQYTCDETITVRNPEAALQLFRIAQEAISNALRHGNASELSVCLERQTNGLGCLVIRDNGRGIPDPLPKNSGLGLRIMQYRAELLGADMEIRPEEAGGTAVVCRFPGEL